MKLFAMKVYMYLRNISVYLFMLHFYSSLFNQEKCFLCLPQKSRVDLFCFPDVFFLRVNTKVWDHSYWNRVWG